MANYAGIAGTKQLTDRIGDEIMEMLQKWFKTVEETSGQSANLEAEGGFELNGEAGLDKNNSIGVAVRAATPNLGPAIPVSIGTDVGVNRSSQGTVRAGISYYFRAKLTASNSELASVRREDIGAGVEDEPATTDRNPIGR